MTKGGVKQMSKRESTRNALNNFYLKEFKKTQRQNQPKKKNQKPEKLTERECILWMRNQGWEVGVFEAKATFNHRAQRWLSKSMSAGVCDCLGTMQNGISIAIEFKAKGKLSTFLSTKNFRQQDFIKSKINFNAFACVVDSVEGLKEIYARWKILKDRGYHEDAKKLLFDSLPKKKRPQRKSSGAALNNNNFSD